MDRIRLDLSKLLGFKIASGDNGEAARRSPKIGAKPCVILGAAQADLPMSALNDDTKA